MTTTHPLLSQRARTTTSSVIRDLLEIAGRPGVLSLAGGLPASELLPVERVRAAADEVLRRDGSDRNARGCLGEAALQYGPTEGTERLRDVIAQRHGWRSGEVVITTGSQQAIDLIARVLLDPGDVVVVESPTYLGSLQAFRGIGADIVAIAGDSGGLRTDDLERRLRGGLRPKLVSVVPEFANPTGATLSGARRRHLAGLADRFGFVVLEDNPYGELRWAGERPEPIGTLTDLAVTVGSASKVLAPGLRLGWLRGPEWLRSAVVRAKQSTDLHTSSLDQLVAAHLLGDAVATEAHLAEIRAVYAARAAALVASIERRLDGRLVTSMPEGGMFLWARRSDGGSAGQLLERGLGSGVAFVPGDAFTVDGTHADSMRLCFATLSPDLLDEAVRRLAECWSADAAPVVGPLTAAG